jgi:hypothetical protein
MSREINASEQGQLLVSTLGGGKTYMPVGYVPIPDRPAPGWPRRTARAFHRAAGVLATFVVDWFLTAVTLLPWLAAAVAGAFLALTCYAGMAGWMVAERLVGGWKVLLVVWLAVGLMRLLTEYRQEQLAGKANDAGVEARVEAVLGAVEQRLAGVEQLAAGRLAEVVDELRGISDHLYDLRADRGQR